ncbi:hypothetical protein Bca52824_019104 [Brassica carinata]|uniref:Uncharacterized protein n=1 Tax=Brassica carinata TaxID=52824 RepID=A0A8X8AZ78_BRACI|nr:hypothetical protein Bca52824_019104 [Brassica carinata]
MGDHDKGKRVEEPGIETKNRAMVGWIECGSAQGAQDAKGHVLPRVMRVQRVPVAEELLDPKELRMVVVKPRSREDSVSERLASVWLDNIRRG